ncbi:hypothetical protein OUZ56_016613 [Daphnia magna]|uniref:Uncharacterized protein n=1 Tax=Daphnia magna TaxID=35525 RepID=A0ABR0AR27_9CRUS|nr:hypothetical protein OUZ56_016613 [Daphnia magna]
MLCSGQRDGKPPKEENLNSKLTLRGIAKDIASGAITIEDVEKNYQAPAETPCSEESDECVEVMAAPPSKPAKSSAAKEEQ